MKKLLSCLLIALLLVISCASAEVLTSLKDVQDVIATTNPLQLLYGDKIDCQLTGTIVEATPTFSEGWCLYRIECDEKGAQNAIMFGYEKPCFYCSGFDYVVGDMVVVIGWINISYSSQTIPYIGGAKIILQRSHNAPVIP